MKKIMTCHNTPYEMEEMQMDLGNYLTNKGWEDFINARGEIVISDGDEGPVIGTVRFIPA